MSPTNNETSGIQLPPPIEQAPVPGTPPETPKSGESAVEKGRPAASEQAPAVMAPAASKPISVPLPLPPSDPTTPPKSDVSTTTQSAALPTTDDGDLIEKEWVNKAKEIVERNRDDPYNQSEEITVVKADYMQKRYNKTIKLNK